MTRKPIQIVEHAHCPCYDDLNEEIRALKRVLARRGIVDPSPRPTTTGASPFAHLSPQDRTWMERKFGAKRG